MNSNTIQTQKMSWTQISIKNHEFLPYVDFFLNSEDMDSTLKKIVNENKQVFTNQFKALFSKKEIECAENSFFNDLLNFDIKDRKNKEMKAYKFTASVGYSIDYTASTASYWNCGNTEMMVFDNDLINIFGDKFRDVLTMDEYKALNVQSQPGSLKGAWERGANETTSGIKKICKNFLVEYNAETNRTVYNTYLKAFSKCSPSGSWLPLTILTVGAKNIGEFLLKIYISIEKDDFGEVSDTKMYFYIEKVGEIKIPLDKNKVDAYEKRVAFEKAKEAKTVKIVSGIGILANLAIAIVSLFLGTSSIFFTAVCLIVSIITGIVKIKAEEGSVSAFIINLICFIVQFVLLKK